MDVAKLQVIIETKGVEAAQRELDKLGKNSGNAEKSVGGLASSMKALGAIASLGAMATLAKEYSQVTDSMKLLEARIKLVSNASENYASIQKNMTVIANENGVSIKEVGNLYTKLSTALKPLGVTTSSVMAVTDAFSKTLLISGASIEEASSATQQFAQAMASGRLQGDEFRSMAENSPRFMKAMTDSLGKTSAELRQMAEDGKLTSSVVGGALIDSMVQIKQEARDMPMTVGKAFNELKNEVTITVEQFDKLTGINDTIAKGFQGITDKVVGLRQELPKLSEELEEWRKQNEKGFYTLGVVGGEVAQVTWDALKLSASGWKNVADWTMYGVGKAGEALGIVNDETLKYVAGQKQIQAEIAKTIKANKDMAQSIEDEVDGYVAKQQFKNIAIPEAEVKKQLDKSLGGFKAYYKAIGDEEAVLSIKRYELREQYKDLTDNQIDSIINAERDKNDKLEQLEKEWQKRKFELTYENEIARSDEMAKPFIELEKKYKEDLEHFKGNAEAKKLLTENYYIEAERLQKNAIEKVNKLEEEKNKKAAEWQVKLFEANEKINDQIIAQREKMYGASSEAQIESWYNNQLEWLGKLALEGKATSEELQGLLNKIDSLKELKLKEQTISFKIEKSFYDSFEKNLTDSIEDAFNGDSLNLKKFFKNIRNALTNTIASSMSGSIVNSLRGGTSLLGGLSSLAVGSSVSASEIASIMNNGGTFDSASNSITTAGGSKINVGADGGGVISKGGSDLSSLVNTVSSLKTAYSVLTGGISSSIMSGFNGVADILAGQGYWSAASGLSNFGYGFANPFSYGGTGAFGSTMAGGALSGGLIGGVAGYGLGTLGDKLFGANTYAGTGGAIGGAAGGIASTLLTGINPILGILGGSLLGSVIGGIFGKKKTTDTGVQFFDNISSLDTITSDMVKTYSDWEKKSWFSKKRGTNYGDLSSSQMKQIESIFDTYDYLLTQLGDNDKIWLDAGKYTGDTFQSQITKNFIKAFTDVDQNVDGTIYQAWTDYATSVNTSVMEAFATSINSFIAEKRAFDIWSVGSTTTDALGKKAQFAKDDFDNLTNSLGIAGVTAENYIQKYNEAIKNNFTPETIKNWNSLGEALMSSTDAAKAYQQALDSIAESNKSFTRNFELWNSSSDTTAQLKLSSGFATQDLDSIKSKLGVQDVTVANFLELYKKATEGITDTSLIEQWQKLGSALMSATDAEKKYKEALGETDLSGLITQIDAFVNSTKSITIFEQLTNAQKAFKDRVGTDFTSKEDLLAYAETLKKKEDLNAADIALYEALYNALNNYDEYVKNAKASIDDVIGAFDNKSALDKFKEAQEAFKAISGETIDSESSLLKYAEVLKNKEDLTEEEIASYQKLSSAMLNYKNELLSTYNEFKSSWSNISTSFKSAYDALNPKKLQTWDEISKTKLTTDNYQSVLDSIEATRQAQINSAQTAADAQITAIESASSARIDSLNKEKDALGNIIGLVDSLKSRIFESANTEFYYKSELAKARISPKDYNYSTLTSAANSYADYAKSTSTSSLDYYRQVAKMSDEIGALKSNFTAGTLEGIEVAIKAQEASLKASQYATTRAVQDATDEANKRASELLKKFGDDADTSVKYYTDLIAGLDKGDASIVLKLEEIKNAILDDTNITLGTKEIHPTDANITLGEKTYLDGSHAGGLERVPFDGYIAELHKGERVQTASEVKNDSMITDLTNSIKDLKDMFIKNIAETSRMSRVITRLDDNDALLVRVVV